MELLFKMNGKNLRVADKERLIFEIDGAYFNVSGVSVPEEENFHPKQDTYCEEPDPWQDPEIDAQGLEEPLLPESVEEVDEEIDDCFGKFGFKNKSGEFVIEPQYAYAHPFTWGLAAVNLNRTWYRSPEGRRYYENHFGYINHRGETVVQFKYDEAWPFNKYGVAVVEDLREGAYLIDTTGAEIPGTRFPYLSHYYDYDDRFFEFSYDNSGDGLEGLYDTKERRIMLEPCIDDLIQWDEDLLLVYRRNGEFGAGDFKQQYLNSKGEDLFPWLTEQGFATIERPNASGIAIVSVARFVELPGNPSSYFPHNGKKYERYLLHGLFSKDKKYLLPLQFQDITEVAENVFACYKDGEISVYRAER